MVRRTRDQVDAMSVIELIEAGYGHEDIEVILRQRNPRSSVPYPRQEMRHFVLNYRKGKKSA
jgi:hypothetical protein